jgi:hypothetical protein
MKLPGNFLGIKALRDQPQALFFPLAQGWKGLHHVIVPPA